MKLSTLLFFVLVVIVSSVATVVVATTTSETETETAATEVVEGSCKASYDSEGNIVEGGDCYATTGDDEDDEDEDGDDEDDEDDEDEDDDSNKNKPGFSNYDCNDMNKDCELWAGQGECDANPKVSGTAVL